MARRVQNTAKCGAVAQRGAQGCRVLQHLAIFVPFLMRRPWWRPFSSIPSF